MGDISNSGVVEMDILLIGWSWPWPATGDSRTQRIIEQMEFGRAGKIHGGCSSHGADFPPEAQAEFFNPN